MFLKESVDIDNHRWKSAKAFWVSRVIKNISRAKPFEFKWPEVLLISKNNKFSLRRKARELPRLRFTFGGEGAGVVP